MWWHEALCQGEPVETFYQYPLDRAKWFCEHCPVTSQCLSAALNEESREENGPFGYRGGLSAAARRKIRSRKAV